MLMSDGTLPAIPQPAFQKPNHSMHARQEVLTFRLAALHLSVVNAALQPQIGVQPIGPHRAAGLDIDKDVKTATHATDVAAKLKELGAAKRK
jgi:hypothetical protein